MGESGHSQAQGPVTVLQAYIQRQAKIVDVYRRELDRLQSTVDNGTQQVEPETGDTRQESFWSVLAELSELQLRAESLSGQLAALKTTHDDVQAELAEINYLRPLHHALIARGEDSAPQPAEAEAFVGRALRSREVERELQNARVYIASLEQALNDKAKDLNDSNAQLSTIQHSLAFRALVKPVWRIRRLLLPEGSRRAAWLGRLRGKDAQPVETDSASPAFEPQPSSPAIPAAVRSIEAVKPAVTDSRSVPAGLPPLKVAEDSDVVFTIISKNYLASARVLMRSIRALHPTLSLVTVLVDEIDGSFEPDHEPFQVLLASELGIPRWRHFSMKYDIMELNTAVKPYAIQVLMEKHKAKRVIYFDPDIQVFSRLDTIFELLDVNLCVLTPHITAPLNDEFSPSELDFLRVGTYNLGFFAVSRTSDWRNLLRWWEQRLYENCTREVERGLFVDQHWMDLVPSLFAPVHILRDPGYNVAYWNLATREMAVDSAGGFTVNGTKLVFFHYSGFSVSNLERVSKHQNRLSFDNLNAAARRCFTEYRQQLLEAGVEDTSAYPYAYGRFQNGLPVTDSLRICLRHADSKGEIWADPYVTGKGSFLEWATQPGSVPPFSLLSPYALTLYKSRADLKTAFPDIMDSAEYAYAEWFVKWADPTDGRIPLYTEPVRRALMTSARPKPAESGATIARKPSALRRLRRAARYYRDYPTKVKPFLLPEAFTEPSPVFTGPTNTYGQIRNLLLRTGLLRRAKRLIGLRLILSAREYFSTTPEIHGFRADREGRSHFERPDSATGAAAPVPITYGVTVVGYLRAETGVGQIARNIIACLQDVDFAVNGYLLDAGNAYRQQDGSVDAARERADRYVQIFNVNADQSHLVYHSLGPAFYARHFNIGYWFWELAEFPDVWQSAFDLYDEIWVASKFVHDAIQPKTTKPVRIVPVSISVLLPEHTSRAQLGLQEDQFLVLFVFDALSVVERKNPWAVIRAFETAFTAQERAESVRLVLKVTNLDRAPEAARLRVEVQRVNGILIETYLDRLEINALISHCDVYISLHRSEGYGLTMAEAMYLGKPVVATGYSGNVDFMNEENSYLVPFKLQELGAPYPPYEAHQLWADPDQNTAAKLLRHIYEHPEEARLKGQIAAQHIRKHYNIQTRGHEIAQQLARILADNSYMIEDRESVHDPEGG
ncbi:MAG: glycosyltransferase [Chloroflexi bacterium]|nr:glycosyltransferase [Chloroflexota bacterium]